MWSEISHSIMTGNIYIWSMLVLAFCTLTVLFERFIMLHFVYNLHFTKFINNLKKMVASEDYGRAIELCMSASSTSLPRISLNALEALERDPRSVKGIIDESTMEFLPKIETRISIIPTIATLILLIGILGTVDELWHAFHAIGILDTISKQTTLATGIAGTLNFTAFGLLVCMIILVGHQLIKGVALRILDEVNRGVVVLINILVPKEVSYTAPSLNPEESTENTLEKSEPAAKDNNSKEEIYEPSIKDVKDEEEII